MQSKEIQCRSHLKGSVIVRVILALLSTIASVTLAWGLLGGSHQKAHATSPTINETTVPGIDPWGLGFDNSGNVWVAEPGCDPTPICGSVKIGHITKYNRASFTSGAGAAYDFVEPTGYSSPVFLAIDASGNIWFSEPMTNSIGELIPNNSNLANSTWNQWTVPTSNAGPFDLAFDSNGKLWFTEITANKIGEFDPSAQQFIGETPTPTGSSKPYGIVGPDPSTGSMWFTENNSSVARIGRFTPPASGALTTGAIKEYLTNSGSTSTTPHLITYDTFGNIWWTEGPDGDIGRLIISQASPGTGNGVQEFHVPSPGCPSTNNCGTHISGIGVDSAGTVWFDDSESSRFGSYVPGTNTFSIYILGGSVTANTHPHDGLAVDGNNNIWISEEFVNKLAEAIQNGAPNPTPGATNTPVLSSPTAKPSPSPTASPTPPPIGSPPVNKTWYFAEGRVGGGFKEFLTFDNPDPGHSCPVNIQYLYTPDGGSAATKTVPVTVPPASRLTEPVNNDLSIQPNQSPGASLSTIVTVTGSTCNGIVAERPMYYQWHGINSGSDVLGATHLGTTFNFAEVPTGGGYSSFITILNPGATAALVTATYYANGQSVATQTLTVPGGTRGTIMPGSANPTLPQHVAAVVTSSQPVMVERPDYFGNINAGNAHTVSGGSDVVGVQTLANDWLFSEGYTGGSFQENLVIANLDVSANTTANVTIRLEYKDGTSHSFNVSVPTKSQLIWNVNTQGAGGTSPEVSADVSSANAKILVERQMFFQYSHTVNGIQTIAMGGTDVIGQVGPATQVIYSFAEGYTNKGYNEWLTLQNPTGNTETITLTLVNGYGRSYTPPAFTVLAHSRYTVDITALVVQHMVQAGDDHRGYEVSMAVASSNNAPFVAERPIYWNTAGSLFVTQGGSDVIGYTGQ